MKGSQLLLIALAAVFAVALCLTIALICLGSAQRKETETQPHTERTYIGASTVGTLCPVTTAPMITTALTQARLDGMVFRTNGNGTCTLESARDCRDAFAVIPERSPAGDLVTGIAARAFYGCETVAAIRIPAAVSMIGDLAFADCPNLVYLSVSESNPCYCDVEGVLYTADGGTLLLYPACHAGTFVTLPATVRVIADMAFYQCTYLSEIRFTGSPAQWEEIRIGSKNYSLVAASVTFYAVW